MSDGPSFQKIILDLHAYWASRGCSLMHPYHTEVGAGTFNPATLLRSRSTPKDSQHSVTES